MEIKSIIMKKLFLLFLLATNVLFAQSLPQQIQAEEHEEDHTANAIRKRFDRRGLINPETGEIDYTPLESMHLFIDQKMRSASNARKTSVVPNIEWKERGPNNRAGRMQKVMYDPNDPLRKKVWAGSNTAGLWYNNDITDANSSWVAADQYVGPAGISAMEYDPTNPQTFYVCGAGMLYKSTNGGTNWTLLGAFRVSDLVVISSTEMYASTNNGVQKSINGGITWTIVLKPSTNIGGTFSTTGLTTNIVTSLQRATDGTLYAAFNCGQLFKSLNGTVWTNISPPLTAFSAGNTLIAPAPSTSGTSQVLYTFAAIDISTGWLYRSADGGNTWTQKTWNYGYVQFYDNFMLKVHPTNPDLVFAGTQSLGASSNGGSTWASINPAGAIAQADYHDIQFNPIDPTKAIISNDQGVSYWTNIHLSNRYGEVRYKDHIANQVHWVAMRQIANDQMIAVAPQDMTAQLLNGSGTTSSTNLFFGEGNWAKFDDDQPNMLLYVNHGSWPQLRLYNTSTGQTTLLTTTTFNWCGSTNPCTAYFGPTTTTSKDYDSQNNVAVVVMGYNPTVAGRLHLRRVSNISTTTNATTNVVTDFYIDGIFARDGITSLIDDFTRPTIVKFGKDPNTLFIAGYGNPSGNIGIVLYKVTNPFSATPIVTRINQGKIWGSTPSCIAIGANDNQIILTTPELANIETLFYTNDGGQTWSNLKKMAGNSATSTGLPANFSAIQALFNPLNYKQVFLTTYAGVWSCDDITDPNLKWEITSPQLSKIWCKNMEARASDGTLIVATYGRGVFSAKLLNCQSDVVKTDVVNGGVMKIESDTYIRGTGGNVISSNAQARYDARNYVLLEPNFEVQKGGTFQAFIDGCGTTLCLLAQESSTWANGSTTNVFNYTPEGYLKFASYSTTETINGNTTVSTSIIQNTFDTNGFLTSTVTQNNGTTNGNLNTSSTVTQTYTYLNNRLSRRNTVSSLGSSNQIDYTYDANGNILTAVQTTQAGSTTTTYSYTNNVISGISYTSANGSVTASTIVVDANGRITSEINPNGTRQYLTYNADGYITRRERWANNQLNTVEEFAFDTKRAPSRGTVYQGHPVLEFFGKTPEKNILSQTLTVSATNQADTITNSYQYDNNLPMQSTRTTIFPNNTQKVETVYFLLTGCK